MDPTTWVTAAVLLLLVVVLVREIAGPSTAMVGALVTLTLLRVVTPEQAFTGFSSTATATVAGLFIVARALQQHAGIDALLDRTLAGADGQRGVLARVCAPVAAASSVIANTPLVAALAPTVKGWADRDGRPASGLLMPLSFAAILGGVATTIGTSTTLVASGVVERATGTPFGLLEVTPLGLPVAVLGTALLVVLAPRLLPERGERTGRANGSYTFRMIVEPGGPLDGRALAEAGLRDLDELFVAAIDRGVAGIAPARPDSRLAGGDELVVVGSVEHMRDLPALGLRHDATPQVHELDEDRTGLHEAVVGSTSPLLGRSLKQMSFRGRYGAAVLAIHRAGTQVEGKLGTVPLEAGDVLLLQAGPGFAERWGDASDFALVAALDPPPTDVSPRRTLVIGVTLAMVVAAAVGLLSLVEAVLWACAALVGTRTLGFRAALDSLDLDVLLIIASAIGVGGAVESSGLAGLVADGMADIAARTTPAIALLVLLIGTALLTELVTNVASAALVVPVALATAAQVGADPRGWAVAVAVGASASFLTPIGYQTNTIVYGLGGYRFTDYWRLGLPLVVLVLTLATVIVPRVWG